MDALQRRMGAEVLSPAEQALWLGTSLAPALAEERLLGEGDAVAEANSRAVSRVQPRQSRQSREPGQ